MVVFINDFDEDIFDANSIDMRVDCFSCRPTKLTATNGASCARSWFIPTTALKNCYHGSMVLTSDSFGCIVGAFLTMPWARRP